MKYTIELSKEEIDKLSEMIGTQIQDEEDVEYCVRTLIEIS